MHKKNSKIKPVKKNLKFYCSPVRTEAYFFRNAFDPTFFLVTASECYNYKVLNEPWRRYVNGSQPVSPLYASCDKDLTQIPSLWVRFSADSNGKVLENTCVSTYHCGVKYPGWLVSKHPLPEDGVVNRTLNFYSSYCGRDTGVVRVRNCYDYYIYNFVSMPSWSCDFGVCIE